MMTKSNDKQPSQVRPSTVLIPTEGMTPEQLDAVAEQMALALIPKINAWREKNGLAPLTD